MAGQVVLVSKDGKVHLISEEKFAEAAYHLGRADQRREDRERLEASRIPRHWVARVTEVLDGA